MKIQILVIGKVNERLKLMRSLNKTLLQKYQLVFYPWPSKGDLTSAVKSCSVVIISGSVASATAAAAKVDPKIEKPIIFITSKEKYKENLKKYISFVTIGHNWRLCVLDDEFLDAVESAINLSNHSHKMRTTLHSVRKQLEDPNSASEHVPYYRQLLELEKNVKVKNKELFKINEELKELDKLKSVFLSMTSHELKTPITPIKAQAESLLAELRGKLNKFQKESVEIILRNTNHLNDLLSDVLDSAKLEVNQLNMFPEKTDLKPVIQNIIKDIKQTVETKNVTITSTIEKLPIIMIDVKRFKQVMLNLVGNSIKYTPPSETIHVSAKKQNKQIIVTVKDTGIGISKEMIPKVFDKFVQVSPSYKLKQKGTGLGLAICKGIVTKLGGKIWAESKGKDKGASFHFTIPIKQKT